MTTDAAAAGPRKPREFKRVPLNGMETVRHRLSLTEPQFSEALGYSSGAFTEWKATGNAPAVAALAAEALARRQASTSEVTIQKQKFLLVPLESTTNQRSSTHA